MEGAVPMVLVKPGVIEKTNIYSGGCELIDSRSIILYAGDEPIEIEEIFSKEFKIRIKITNTKTDKDERGISIDVDLSQNLIHYTCINFDNVLGTGTTKAIEIGELGGKKMYIHLWIYALGAKDAPARKLEYSIWKER